MAVEFSNEAGLSTSLKLGVPVDILPTSNNTADNTRVHTLKKNFLHLLAGCRGT